MAPPFQRWFKNAKPIIQDIKHEIISNPNLRSPIAWSIWLIPTLCVPPFRYLQDRTRPKADRLKISVRDFAAYAVGLILFFTSTPASAPVFSRLLRKRYKDPIKLDKAKALATTIFGSFVSSVYSGFGAMPFAQWIERKFMKPKEQKKEAIGPEAKFYQNVINQNNQQISIKKSAETVQRFYRHQPLLFPYR